MGYVSEVDKYLRNTWQEEAASDAQKRRLRQIASSEAREALTDPKLTKGKASRIIGLSEPCDWFEAKVLRYFGESPEDFSSTDARERVTAILSDPITREQWCSSPPDSETELFFKATGAEKPDPFTRESAARRRIELEATMPEAKLRKFDKSLDQLQKKEEAREELIDDELDRAKEWAFQKYPFLEDVEVSAQMLERLDEQLASMEAGGAPKKEQRATARSTIRSGIQLKVEEALAASKAKKKGLFSRLFS